MWRVYGAGMTTPRTDKATTESNPWLIVSWFAAGLVLFAGLFLTAENADPAAEGYSPAAGTFGPVLLTIGGVLLTGALLAGAICWQLRRR